MTDDLEDFSQWRASIESRLVTLEVKVETEAHLRAAMDKDMGTLGAKFGAQERLIQAVAETQSEHTALLRDHTALLRDHTARLTRLEVGQEELRTKLGRVHVGVEAIHTLLTGLPSDKTREEAKPVDADPGALSEIPQRVPVPP
jgi:hypothetical protein